MLYQSIYSPLAKHMWAVMELCKPRDYMCLNSKGSGIHRVISRAHRMQHVIGMTMHCFSMSTRWPLSHACSIQL